MIRRLVTAALDAGTLSRTVLVLSRQLDNAHLLAASEEARADRAEADHSAEQMARRRVTVERDAARERVAELEAQQRDWAELSGELAAEQPAADPLPDLTDAAPPPVTPDPLRETDYQRDRADSLMRTLHATEAVVLDLRARLATAEREAKEARAQLQQTERAAGAHIATIERLQEQIAAAHRAAHAPARSLRDRADNARAAWEAAPHTPEDDGLAWQAVVRACDTSAAPAEQIPGVAGATPYAIWSAEYDAAEAARVPAPLAGKLEPDVCDACRRPTFDGERTGEAEAVLLCGRCRATAEAEEAARPPRIAPREVRYAAVMKVSAEIDAAADDPPPTRPSERATRTT